MIMKKSLASVILLFLAACSLSAPIGPLPVIPLATDTPAPPTATQTGTPTLTATWTSTFTPSLTPTATWAFQPAGEVTCPILLYHHIDGPDAAPGNGTRYSVSSSDFEAQMSALRDWGYTAIPISLLVRAITVGAELPPRPVVLTFDDGYTDVYNYAYPIMQKYGFVGVVYIIAGYMGGAGYMTPEQIQELASHGWEVGSHSMTHAHLPAVPDRLTEEGSASRALLKSTLGVEVNTFAYPYGEIDPNVVEKIAKYGYTAAVGLGVQDTNGMRSLFYLSRIEVRNGTSLEDFAALLPWPGR